MKNITIDKNSGFCFGVVNAIKMAEEVLDRSEKLYCLGDIVHNGNEVKRLEAKGLEIINHDQLKNLKNCKVLIRAHGEPPNTYKIAIENNIELIDASCPVVLKLQNKIRLGYEDIKSKNGQVVIYGKKGHAEVNGLVGQTFNEAIIISSENDLDKIDYSKPIVLYSQTTMGLNDYDIIKNLIEERIKKIKGKDNYIFIAYNTICRQVSNRGPELDDFAKKHDVIIFVSGRKSSNGNMLYQVCKNSNTNTHFISFKEELKKEWFEGVETVGICGATSTPMWLMKEIESTLKKFI